MAQQINCYETVRYKLQDLHEQRKMLMELVLELLQQMIEVEQEIAALYEGCQKK